MNKKTAFVLLLVGFGIIYFGYTQIGKSKKQTENLPDDANHIQKQAPKGVKMGGMALIGIGASVVFGVLYYVFKQRKNKKNTKNRSTGNFAANAVNAGTTSSLIHTGGGASHGTGGGGGNTGGGEVDSDWCTIQ